MDDQSGKLREAHDVPGYLDDRGDDVVPVNPYAEEILGRPALDTLAEADSRIDLVCIFRPSDEVSGIVDTALEREDVDVIWTQRGIRDERAASRAEAAGRTVVQDRCLKVVHRRLAT
jgi:uncharacterized protein